MKAVLGQRDKRRKTFYPVDLAFSLRDEKSVGNRISAIGAKKNIMISKNIRLNYAYSQMFGLGRSLCYWLRQYLIELSWRKVL